MAEQLSSHSNMPLNLRVASWRSPTRCSGVRVGSSSLHPKISKKLELTREAIFAHGRIRIKVVFLIREVARQQVSNARIDVEFASAPARDYAVAESPRARERRQVVLVSMDDDRRRHPGLEVLDRRIVGYARVLTQQPLEMTVGTDIDGR